MFSVLSADRDVCSEQKHTLVIVFLWQEVDSRTTILMKEGDNLLFFCELVFT